MAPLLFMASNGATLGNLALRLATWPPSRQFQQLGATIIKEIIKYTSNLKLTGEIYLKFSYKSGSTKISFGNTVVLI